MRAFRTTLLALLSLLLLLPSCRSEWEGGEQLSDKTVITFSPVIEDSETSRATQSNFFDEGDEVGIFAYTAGTTVSPIASNVRYRYRSATQTFEAVIPTTALKYSGTPLDVYVYYPYNSSNGDATQIVHEALAVQSTAQNWQNSDFLTATIKGVNASKVALRFLHRYATIEAVIAPADQIKSIAVKGLSTATTANLLTGNIQIASAVKDVSLYHVGSGIYRATVPATLLSKSTHQIFVSYIDTIGGSVTMDLNTPSKQLEEGKRHRLNGNVGFLVAIEPYLSGGTTTGAGNYLWGKQTTLTATANNGYTFHGWKEKTSSTVLSTSSPFVYTVRENITFIPLFRNTAVTSVQVEVLPSLIGKDGGTAQVQLKVAKTTYENGIAISTVQETITSGFTVLSGTPTMITVNGTSLSISANPNTTERTGQITVQYEGNNYPATIRQEAGITQTFVFTFGDGTTSKTFTRDLTTTASGYNYTLPIISHKINNGVTTALTPVLSGTLPVWIKNLQVSNNRVAFTTEKNTEATTRRATFTLLQQESSKTLTITITQDAGVAIGVE